ncbi:hypothetical protein [Natranaerofaba carboxydovora]|uniref:hypothetical protein n=1 Tax=Natranaerofaba carboxydovora TaxID=2742683 RepID=UPI001F139A66|nr:hypothetical protein [Natranaerofaba carboxydovora]UMZ74157.1 hypothetical protein ACONDI_01737 [Natranaerofaba carboxydovora]
MAAPKYFFQDINLKLKNQDTSYEGILKSLVKKGYSGEAMLKDYKDMESNLKKLKSIRGLKENK